MAARPDDDDLRAELARFVDDRARGVTTEQEVVDDHVRPGDLALGDLELLADQPGRGRLDRARVVRHAGHPGQAEQLRAVLDDADDPDAGPGGQGQARDELAGSVGRDRTVDRQQDAHGKAS